MNPTDQPTPTPETEPCNLPPTGWICTRTKGHTGPCAAVPGARPKTRIAELEAQLEEALRQLGEMASEMEDATVAHAIAENERDAAIADREKLREQVEKLEGDVQLLTAAKTDANIARKKAIAERDALAAKICEQQP